MIADLHPPGPNPEGSDQPVDLVVPHPVPPGLLEGFIGALDARSGLDGCAGGSIAFAGVEDLSPEARVGWQVGVLVRLLPHGLSSVRGVDPEVLRRVNEVLRLIEEAR